MAGITQAYLDLLQQISDQCGRMLESEKRKRDALVSSNEHELAEVLQGQQAELMKLESLEKQRAQMQQQLGFNAMTASEIEKQLENEENRRAFSELSIQLRDKACELKALNEVSLDIAREQLSFIRQVTEKTPAAPQVGTYTPGRPAKSVTRPMFEEKI